MNTITAVIPARLTSTRLPGKVLLPINGRPLLWHVWRQVARVDGVAGIVVVTDSAEVHDVVIGWGGQALMTSPECASGTERIASVLEQIPGDGVLNVQGDEPMVDPVMLSRLLADWRKTGGDLITPVYPISALEDLRNPNVVKVVRARDGRALYFSRGPVPYQRDQPVERWLERPFYWGHVGVYGYRRGVLEAYPGIPESPLEGIERLEQLRFLDAGYTIQTFQTDYRSIAVDTPADLEMVRRQMVEQS